MWTRTPQTNLWIERSRLDGMVLGSISYGVFFILTVQSFIALIRRPRQGGKIADHRTALIVYIAITFILVTISTAADAKYTEMIWIDLRDAPGGPLALIENPFLYRINILALCTGHIQEWIMQALLLYRCFIIWDWAKSVMIPMVMIYTTMIGLSIVVQVESSSGAIFYSLNTELAYFCIQVGHTVLYTILAVYRMLSMRSQLRQVEGQNDSGPYGAIVLMVVESAMTFTIFALIFIIAFALGNEGVVTLCFLSIGKVQGITQLFIILRVAKQRALTSNWSTEAAMTHTAVRFAGATDGSDTTGDSNDEGIAKPEQGIALSMRAPSEKAADGVDVSIIA